jgi:hypothetical protein
MSIKHARHQTPVAMSDIVTFARLTTDYVELTLAALSRPCRAGEVCF